MHTTTTTTTTTTIAPAGRTATTVDDIVQAASAWASDQLLLSQGRCVDVLLDLYLATDDVGLRWSIADRLDEIRFLNAVSASEFRADLAAIGAIATSSQLAEPEWTVAAMNECSVTWAA
jgi:hypothetical protein